MSNDIGNAPALRLAPGLVAAIVLAGCSGIADVHVPFHNSIALSAPVRFSLNNPAGTVRIDGWNEPRAEIDGTKTGRSLADANAIGIVITRAGDGLSVTTRYPAGMRSGGVTYVIHLPENTPVDVNGSAGTIDVRGMSSDVSATLQAGTIDVTMARLGGRQRIDLESTTGTIRLRVPHHSDATIAATTSVGKTNVNVPSTIGNGSAAVTLSTKVGTATVDYE